MAGAPAASVDRHSRLYARSCRTPRTRIRRAGTAGGEDGRVSRPDESSSYPGRAVTATSGGAWAAGCRPRGRGPPELAGLGARPRSGGAGLRRPRGAGARGARAPERSGRPVDGRGSWPWPWRRGRPAWCAGWCSRRPRAGSTWAGWEASTGGRSMAGVSPRGRVGRRSRARPDRSCERSGRRPCCSGATPIRSARSAVGEHLAGLIPGAVLRVVAGATHDLARENPAPVARLIEAHLR